MIFRNTWGDWPLSSLHPALGPSAAFCEQFLHDPHNGKIHRCINPPKKIAVIIWPFGDNYVNSRSHKYSNDAFYPNIYRKLLNGLISGEMCRKTQAFCGKKNTNRWPKDLMKILARAGRVNHFMGSMIYLENHRYLSIIYLPMEMIYQFFLISIYQ